MKTIGVIGLGSIGLRHAKNLIEMGHQVYGWDPNIERMEKFIEMGGLAIYSSREEPLVTIVASPTKNHLIDISHCINMINHVFVEKPIASGDRDTVRDCVYGAKSYGRVLFVGYNLRFHSCVIQAKSWLDDGFIGTPVWGNFICSQFNDKPDYLRDGVILNWSHELDLALYLLGPAHVTSCLVQHRDGHEDVADITLQHEGLRMLQSTIHLDYIGNPELRGFYVVGTRGRITVDLVDRRATLKTLNNCIKHSDDYKGSYDQDYKDEMQAFLDRIDGKQTLGATGEEGLAVLELCLEARKMAGLK